MVVGKTDGLPKSHNFCIFCRGGGWGSEKKTKKETITVVESRVVSQWAYCLALYSFKNERKEMSLSHESNRAGVGRTACHFVVDETCSCKGCLRKKHKETIMRISVDENHERLLIYECF